MHVLAGAVWVGSLFTTSLRVMPWFIDVASNQRTLILEVFQRPSTTAGVSVLLILITGLLNSWQGLGHVGSLCHSRYGQILLAKLALVAWMVGIGARNRYVKMPQLAYWANRTPHPRPLVARIFASGNPFSEARPSRTRDRYALAHVP